MKGWLLWNQAGRFQFNNVANFFMKERRISRGGFSLLELLVAMSVFALVSTVATGSLMTMVDAQRRSQQTKSVMNNLQFSMENITRNIRVGSSYRCGTGNPPSPSAILLVPRNCPGGGSWLSFRPTPGTENERMIFALSGQRIVASDNGGTSYYALTAEEVIIDDFQFYVFGAGETSTQSRVRVVIKGRVSAGVGAAAQFNLFTTITQREPDR
jgi:prepilin-type N-terminal cleavage/methylation domain-containing protein